jgi:hypothetical protein
MICEGFDNVNISYNYNKSLSSFLKIKCNDIMDGYLYKLYFEKIINKMLKKNCVQELKLNDINSIAEKIKKKDIIRLETNHKIDINDMFIYENQLIQIVEKMLKYYKQFNETNTKKSKYLHKWQMYFITLYSLIKNNITNVNIYVLKFVKNCIELYSKYINYKQIVNDFVCCIEQNNILNKYNDITLYDHQKQIFTHFDNNMNTPSLVLYTAPTGTGKTLTPLGLSNNKKIIFVCVARHVGLALAKSAISIGKKTAFAYGCESAEDIRLHYFSVKDHIKNKKSGGIGKVDNSVGDKVEIMICDVKSYLVAMYYMLAFNEENDIITYWDEPTITMDYEHHELHSVIKDNWKNNKISKMVLSSATLPKCNELSDTICGFQSKFNDAIILNINSNDCRNTIPVLNKMGYSMLPHNLSNKIEEIHDIMEYCVQNQTTLRYFDVDEIQKVITFIHNDIYNDSDNDKPNNLFDMTFCELDDITITNIKLYYINLIKSLDSVQLEKLLDYTNNNRKNILNASYDNCPMSVAEEQKYDPILITTRDAHTLTDGPTIFLTNNVLGIANLYIKQTDIPVSVISNIISKIDYNNKINIQIQKYEKNLEDAENALDTQSSAKIPKKGGDAKSNSKGSRNSTNTVSGIKSDENTVEIQKTLNGLANMIKTASLNDTFKPNTPAHLTKWCNNNNIVQNNKCFTCDIDDDDVIRIMSLNDIDDSLKILLLMGIGVFMNHKNKLYTEIMKQLADKQKLYLIIASSDYIYGTNYQFCHGYISKDMDLSQEKIIQAIGRIGRNSNNQQYTIRFRCDEDINKLFSFQQNKPEVTNMNLLFSYD